MFELSLSYPPHVRQQQQLINMKFDQEDVEPPSLATEVVPSVEDLSCQRDGPFNCWRSSNTEVLHQNLELQFYGTPGPDVNSPVESRTDDTEADDFSEMKSDRHESSSFPTAVVQEYQQHLETTDLADDEFSFEELGIPDIYECDWSVLPPPCGNDSRRVTQEKGVHTAVFQSLPLPKIKRSVLCSNREQIRTALKTFEQVRQQIMKDPTYGQALLESSQTTNERSKGNSKRVRADLKAASLMRLNGFWLNEEVRPIGDVPGVVIGDCFRYRIEMAVIGLHKAIQAGIAVVPLEVSSYGKPVACSVIFGVNDRYEDDKDMGEIVEYSGQGGLCNKTKESQDQKLERGNLALSNSYELKLPIRFIRGHKQKNNLTGTLYSYDGLYQVVDMNYVNGVNGKKVFKFLMKRLPGQPPWYFST